VDRTLPGRSGVLPTGAVTTMEERDRTGAVSRRGFLTAAGMSFVAATLAGCGGAADTIGPASMTGGTNTSGNGSSPAGTLPPGVTIAGSAVVINLVTQSALASAGGFLVVNSGTVHAMVVNLGGNTFSAFTSVCTHDGCNNSWTFTGTRFQCNCHGSQFNTTGAAVVGPASLPLTMYPAAFDMNTNTVTITTAG
jgi:cytochrome b6-f complex iron-sulfur subunit